MQILAGTSTLVEGVAVVNVTDILQSDIITCTYALPNFFPTPSVFSVDPWSVVNSNPGIPSHYATDGVTLIPAVDAIQGSFKVQALCCTDGTANTGDNSNFNWTVVRP